MAIKCNIGNWLAAILDVVYCTCTHLKRLNITFVKPIKRNINDIILCKNARFGLMGWVDGGKSYLMIYRNNNIRNKMFK